jgi:propanediol dehydratase small subunit
MDYPLINHAAALRASSGRALNDVTLQAVADGSLAISDLQISAEALRAQAAIAQAAGYAPLAANLLRAAELTAVPNAEVLRMYETLRPQRASAAELAALAEQLETQYNAPTCAAFVREALAVYQRRGLLRDK